MTPKVGVIIPSYNQGKYIEDTICSVLDNQKHADIKIIVIDGGSNDESVSIIKKYESQIDYWVSESDNGQSDAINKGFMNALDCKYFMWLNSDDVYEDEYAVQRMVDYVEKNNYDVCYAKSHYIDEEGKITGEYSLEKYSFESLKTRCYISQPSVIFSTEAYRTVGPINVSLKMCMDYEYWIRLGKRYDIGFFDSFIGSTRIYADTKTSTMKKRGLQEGIMLVDHYYDIVPKGWTLPLLWMDTQTKGLKKMFRLVMVRMPGKIKNRTVRNMIKEFGFTIDYMD